MDKQTSKTFTIGSGECCFCKKDNSFEATEYELKGYPEWYAQRHSKGRPNIQEALPNLSAGKREVLITGMCIKCQEKVFSDIEYPEDEFIDGSDGIEPDEIEERANEEEIEECEDYTYKGIF